MSKKNNAAVPVQCGQTYNLTIDDLGARGEGIGKIDGFTVFAPGALPGEQIQWQATVVKKNYATGRCQQIITPSPSRCQPRCPLSTRCGGCQIQNLSYAAQLEWKERTVRETLSRIGGVTTPNVLPVKFAAEPWRYRNKMQFPVGMQRGKTVIGCYAAGSHRVVNTNNCLIQQDGNNDIIRAVREVAAQYGIAIYDEGTGRGLLRHIVGRVGADGELMLVLVTAGENLLHAPEIIRTLRKKLPRLVSLHQNIQPAVTNVVMGEQTKLLWGKPIIHERIGEFTFAVSPNSFFQVNTAATEILYDTVREFAALTGSETVLDAYCGIGTIGMYLAKQAQEIIGVEIVPSAVKDAAQNAALNHISNATFKQGDAAKLVPELINAGKAPNVVILDPPRSGCAPSVVAAVGELAPSRLIYVSCNAATLARDAALLRPYGYEITAVQPVDMFPQTANIETVALFLRVSAVK